VSHTLYERVTDDHVKRVVSGLRGSNPGKESLFEGAETGKFNGWDKAKFEKFIQETGLKRSPETDQWLLDLDYWREPKTLRREDQWQS